MSDLQRSFARAQLSRLPLEAPIFDEREEDEENDEESHVHSASDSSTSSTGTIVPSPTKHLFARPTSSKRSTPLSPLEWSEFFDTEFSLPRQIGTSNLLHHVYFSPPLSSGPLFVTHHGAGSSGLSFACFAKEVKALIPKAGILSLDARGHGKTTISPISPPASPKIPRPSPPDPSHPDPPPIDLDLSLDTLASDLTFILHAVQKRMSWPSLPDLVLVGHSLGGAVVVHVANQEVLRPSILGYAVLDVVEGSAMEALAHMETYLTNRPTSFPTVEKAIDWHIRSRTLRNPQSARISVPALLKPSTPSPNSNSNSNLTPPHPTKYTFHPPLLATSPLWPTWFSLLSSKFLRAPAAKLLILAGTDRLDKELTIGQMQGKYQLCVVPEAGHFVHEDQPAKVAEVVVGFWRRNERGAVRLPVKKVGGE